MGAPSCITPYIFLGDAFSLRFWMLSHMTSSVLRAVRSPSHDAASAPLRRQSLPVLDVTSSKALLLARQLHMDFQEVKSIMPPGAKRSRSKGWGKTHGKTHGKNHEKKTKWCFFGDWNHGMDDFPFSWSSQVTNSCFWEGLKPPTSQKLGEQPTYWREKYEKWWFVSQCFKAIWRNIRYCWLVISTLVDLTGTTAT